MSTSITNLPEAVGSLTGSEIIPIVQNGVTKRASASQVSLASTNALTSSDIGVTVQGYDATLLNAADIGVTVQGYDATILKAADIGVTVQAAGNYEPADATILKDADIGVTVQAYTTGVLSATDIGVTVQGYDVDTAKLDVIQAWAAAQTFNDGNLKLNGATSGAITLKAPAIASTYTHTLPAATATLAGVDFAQTWSAIQTFGDGNIKLNGATSGTQTLKAAAIASTYTSTLPAVTGTLAAINFAQTWSADQTFTETTETTYALSGTDIDPANGAIQSKTISGTTSFTATNFAAGQCVVVALTDGGSHTVNWPTITWVRSTGNSAPTLTAYSVVVLWKIGTTLYGSYTGSGV